MASKAETRAAIVALSSELGKEPPAGLEQIDKMDQLEPLLKALEAEKASKASTPPAPTPPAPPAGDGTGGDGVTELSDVGGPPPPPTLEDPEGPKQLVATTYVVNEGRMVTTKRGAIGALEHVWPTDFRGGQKDLDHWVAHGFVTKTDHYG